MISKLAKLDILKSEIPCLSMHLSYPYLYAYQDTLHYTNNKLPSIFTNWFTFSSMSHNYQTSFASKGNLQIPSAQTISYGKNAFVYMIIRTWNDIQKEMKGVMLNTFSLVKTKIITY